MLPNLRKNIANKYLIIPTAVLSCALGFLFNPEIKTKNSLEARIEFGIPKACAFETGNFEVPVHNEERNEVVFEGDVYYYDRSGWIDKDKNGTKETRLDRWFIPNGKKVIRDRKRVIRYNTNGKIWAWSIVNNPSDKYSEDNYVLRDSDGKDGFDEMYKFKGEHFYLPEYLQEPPKYNEKTNEVTFNGEVYYYDKSYYLDWDEDGKKETFVKRFIHSPKKRIIQSSKDGKTWGWGIFGNRPDKNDFINNYAIIDTDGDNNFDRKYRRGEDFYLPNYLK